MSVSLLLLLLLLLRALRFVFLSKSKFQFFSSLPRQFDFYRLSKSSNSLILTGLPCGEVLTYIDPSIDQTLNNSSFLRISFARFMIFFLYEVRFTFTKILSTCMRVDDEQWGKVLETLTFFSLVLALYGFVLTLWLMNFTIIGLLPFLFSLWHISISFDSTDTSRPPLILALRLLSRCKALSGTPCISSAFFLAYCSSLSWRSYNSPIPSIWISESVFFQTDSAVIQWLSRLRLWKTW